MRQHSLGAIAAAIAAAAVGLAGCEGNKQSMSIGGGTTGNITQSQSGMGNSQSMSIGGSSDGSTPNITQTQSGVNKSQSLTIDGKKVESTSK